jgi:hypothetical protein
MLRILLIHLLLILGIAATAVIYAMPPVLAIPYVLLCLWLLYWRKQKAETAMLLASMLVLFGILEIFVRMFSDDIFYREHEKWALKGKYRANVEDTLRVRFGDMIAMDPTLKEKLAEPHDIRFVTDSLGFRNEKDYSGEPYILLGDSFTASTGITHEETLATQLNNIMPGHFYSMGYPGAPRDYESRALTFLAMGHDKARFLWFVFEGNDFKLLEETGDAPRRPSLKPTWKEYFSLRNLPFMTTRVLVIFFKAVGARAKSREEKSEDIVQVFDVGSKPMGFFGKYIHRSGTTNMEFRILGTEEVMSRTACVFFIPEKYRVYKPWIKYGPPVSEPAEGLKILKTHFKPHNIPIIDLTPALQKAAKAALPHKTVFWRDDTHWNPSGISAILPDIKRCIDQDKAKYSIREN